MAATKNGRFDGAAQTAAVHVFPRRNEADGHNMAVFFLIALSILYSMISEDEDALRGRKSYVGQCRHGWMLAPAALSTAPHYLRRAYGRLP